MIVLVDIGNTRLKYSFYDQNKNIEVLWLDNVHLSMNWMNEHWSNVKQVIIANVGQAILSDAILSWSNQNNIDCVIVHSEKHRKSLMSGYVIPEQLGVDRWLALIGALKIQPNSNVLIVDAGTATTVDLLSESGQHHGGWILPGIDTMFNSVISQTSNVNAIQQGTLNLKFGINSSENLNNACWAATLGLISEAIKVANQMNMEINQIILTGGNAKSLGNLLTFDHIVVPDLVFYGLTDYIKD